MSVQPLYNNYTNPGSQLVTVPADVFSMDVVAVGGGGGGGGGQSEAFSSDGDGGGGGGGGGGCGYTTGIAVTPGELIQVVVGGPGTGGEHLESGTAGGDSIITRFSTSEVLARGNGGGSGADTGLSRPERRGGPGGTFTGEFGGNGGAGASGSAFQEYGGGGGGVGGPYGDGGAGGDAVGGNGFTSAGGGGGGGGSSNSGTDGGGAGGGLPFPQNVLDGTIQPGDTALGGTPSQNGYSIGPFFVPNPPANNFSRSGANGVPYGAGGGGTALNGANSVGDNADGGDGFHGCCGIVFFQNVDPTASLSVSATEIISGETVTLTWSSTFGESYSLTGTSASSFTTISAGSSASGTEDVSPTETTTYTYTVTNANGTATASVTVTVYTPFSVTDFSFSDNPICPGSTSTISYDIADDFQTGRILAPGGATLLDFDETTRTGTLVVSAIGSYTLQVFADFPTAQGNAGPYDISQAFVLNSFTNTSVAFDDTGATIVFGNSDTFSWTSSGSGSTVSIDQGIGAVATSGSQTVSPTDDTTYTITNVGTCDTTTDTYTITVLKFPPTITDFNISATAGSDPAGTTGDRTIYANQTPSLTLNWTYDFTGGGVIASQQIEALYSGNTTILSVTPTTETSFTTTEPWASLGIPYGSTVQYRLRVFGPNGDSNVTSYISISTVGPATINSFTASPNPQLSPTGTPEFDTLLSWNTTNGTTDPQIVSGAFSLSALAAVGSTTVTNLPQSEAGVNSPASRTYTLSVTNPGSSASQDVTVNVTNDNTPATITVDTLPVPPDPFTGLEPDTVYYVRVDFTGTDMPVRLSPGGAGITVSLNSTTWSTSPVIIPLGQNFCFVRFTSAPFNPSEVPSGVNGDGLAIGQTNSITISYSIGSVADSFVATTREPIIEEEFNFNPIIVLPTFPDPDIDTVPNTTEEFVQSDPFIADDIEVANEIKTSDPNVQVRINGIDWESTREI